MISTVIQKIDNDNQEDVDLFVNFILRYYESNALKELFNSIISATEKDVQLLSEMICDWGLREIANIADITTQQIEIIKKLDTFVKNPNTLERDIHKIFENNIWLLSEKYTLWSSNKQLKSIFKFKYCQRIYEQRISKARHCVPNK